MQTKKEIKVEPSTITIQEAKEIIGDMIKDASPLAQPVIELTIIKVRDLYGHLCADSLIKEFKLEEKYPDFYNKAA